MSDVPDLEARLAALDAEATEAAAPSELERLQLAHAAVLARRAALAAARTEATADLNRARDADAVQATAAAESARRARLADAERAMGEARAAAELTQDPVDAERYRAARDLVRSLGGSGRPW